MGLRGPAQSNTNRVCRDAALAADTPWTSPNARSRGAARRTQDL